jgi:hypothetical protein
MGVLVNVLWPYFSVPGRRLWYRHIPQRFELTKAIDVTRFWAFSHGDRADGAHPCAASAQAGHQCARLAGLRQHRAGRPGGNPARVFLQEELFGPEAYRQIVAYHDGLARHHLFKAQTSRDHAKARDGLQLPLFSNVRQNPAFE